MILTDFIPYTWRQGIKRRLFFVNDMRTRLQNLRRAGFMPTGAIDAGAHRGDWTHDLWSVWPGCPVMLVEPQPDCRAALEKLAGRVPGSSVVPAALSSEPGRANFRLGGSGSAICEDSDGSVDIVVEKTTLRQLLDQFGEFRPNLIKLDLQGHELEALKGADDIGIFEVIILEISVLRIGEVPIFYEVDRYLESNGYRLYDVIPQWYRPLDGALWQIDAVYVNHSSLLIASRKWR